MPYKGTPPPEFLEKKRAYARQWHRDHPEYAGQWRAEHREQIRARGREIDRARRATDPEYVERVRRKNMASHYRNREQRLASRNAKWPEIRDASNAKRRAHHAANRQTANAKRKENAAMRRQLYPWEKLLRAAEGRARKKGIEFSLTRNWAEARWTGTCEVSGLPFIVKDVGEPGPKFFSPSIDQIRPKGGYTPENCRFVLWAVNALKHDGSDEDMMLVAKAIVEKNSL